MEVSTPPDKATTRGASPDGLCATTSPPWGGTANVGAVSLTADEDFSGRSDGHPVKPVVSARPPLVCRDEPSLWIELEKHAVDSACAALHPDASLGIADDIDVPTRTDGNRRSGRREQAR